MSYLVIGHDLGLVNHLSDRIAVMYRGHLVEEGPAGDVYGSPRHPYTRSLFEAEPVADPSLQRHRRTERIAHRRPVEARAAIQGGVGCPYVGNCPHAMVRCSIERPALRPVDAIQVACHLFDSGAHAPP